MDLAGARSPGRTTSQLGVRPFFSGEEHDESMGRKEHDVLQHVRLSRAEELGGSLRCFAHH